MPCTATCTATRLVAAVAMAKCWCGAAAVRPRFDRCSPAAAWPPPQPPAPLHLPCHRPPHLPPAPAPAAVNERRDHIPPVVSGSAVTFPFDITVAGCALAAIPLHACDLVAYSPALPVRPPGCALLACPAALALSLPGRPVLRPACACLPIRPPAHACCAAQGERPWVWPGRRPAHAAAHQPALRPALRHCSRVGASAQPAAPRPCSRARQQRWRGRSIAAAAACCAVARQQQQPGRWPVGSGMHLGAARHHSSGSSGSGLCGCDS